MEKKQEKRNITALLGDALLTIVSVCVLGVTFYGLTAMTPKTEQQIAQGNSNVLGATNTISHLQYFPQSLGNLPYVKSSTFSGTTNTSTDSTVAITFKALEATSYEFTVLNVKNDSAVDKKLLLTPKYSLEGSYTKVSMVYEGQSMEIVSTNGTISPVEMVISAHSTEPITIVMQPTTPILVQPTLTLVFTEKP